MIKLFEREQKFPSSDRENEEKNVVRKGITVENDPYGIRFAAIFQSD